MALMQVYFVTLGGLFYNIGGQVVDCLLSNVSVYTMQGRIQDLVQGVLVG